jgi:hypothetical protein
MGYLCVDMPRSHQGPLASESVEDVPGFVLEVIAKVAERSR